MSRVHDLIDRLAVAEERFRAGEFLAPAVRGGVVFVRVAGVICRFAVPKRFRGWGVFRPDGTRAILVRPATLAERQRYLDLFPRRPMILVHADGPDWLGWPVHQADARFGPPIIVPLRLTDCVQPFDRVVTRFDGVQAWFDRVDETADASAAVWLREALREMLDPALVHRPRLTLEERTAYSLAWQARKDALRDRTEDRLRDALSHAGAEYRAHSELDDGYRVEFAVGNARHVSVVNKSDLTVQLAGICLDGADRHFDLSSLVGVLRLADGVLQIGDDGMPADQYWQIHPPR
jgi:hypothetical protein